MIYDEEIRQTGRTTRVVAAAINAARNGKKVCLFCNKFSVANYIDLLVKKLSDTSSQTKFIYEFGIGSLKIEIIYPDYDLASAVLEKTQGQEYDVVFFDHLLLEVSAMSLARVASKQETIT